jgi:hypothetical protein
MCIFSKVVLLDFSTGASKVVVGFADRCSVFEGGFLGFVDRCCVFEGSANQPILTPKAQQH